MGATAQVLCPVCADSCEGLTACGRCGLPLAGRQGLLQSLSGSPAAVLENAPLPWATSAEGLLPVRAELPQAGRREHPLGETTSEPAVKEKSAPKTTKRASAPAPILPAGMIYIVKSALSIIFLLALAASAILLLLSHRQAKSPSTAIPRLAEHYLSALAATDDPSAYLLLSIEAQARCSLDEFHNMRGPGSWSWSNVKLVKLEPEAALISYDLSVQNQPRQNLYLFFIRENDRWALPYNLNLLKKVETAVRRSDPDLALLESQEAVRVNPRDPMARAYLCEAAYYRKINEQALPACQAVLELAARYPSNLSAQSLQHAQDILAKLKEKK